MDVILTTSKELYWMLLNATTIACWGSTNDEDAITEMSQAQID